MLHASAQGSCCSSAKELTQVSSAFGLVLSGEVPVTVQLLRLPAQMRMRFVTLTREALENGRGAFDACAFLARRSKHASVKDIIFKLQESVGKALRAPFLDQFREEGPQPASGVVGFSMVTRALVEKARKRSSMAAL